jgi:hypothetical protein
MGGILDLILECLDAHEPDACVLGNVTAGEARDRIRALIGSEDVATDRVASLEETLRQLAFRLVQESDTATPEFRALDTSEALAKVGVMLHDVLADHSPPTMRSTDGDGLDALGRALYGRKPRPGEYIGGSDARILHDAAKALCVKSPTAFANVATRREALSADDDAKVELWGMLTAMLGNGETVAALSDHELAAKLEGGQADMAFHSREYALVESLLARLERSGGGPCEPLDGESDPEFRKARVCNDCEQWLGDKRRGSGKHCKLFTIGKTPSECPAWKRKRPGVRGKLADVVALDDAAHVPTRDEISEAAALVLRDGEQSAPRCTCGCDGVLVKHDVCAWPECGSRATHVRPMCGGPGAVCDVPLCAEHFDALESGAHAGISISGHTARDDEPTVPGGVTPGPRCAVCLADMPDDAATCPACGMPKSGGE